MSSRGGPSDFPFFVTTWAAVTNRPSRDTKNPVPTGQGMSALKGFGRRTAKVPRFVVWRDFRITIPNYIKPTDCFYWDGCCCFPGFLSHSLRQDIAKTSGSTRRNSNEPRERLPMPRMHVLFRTVYRAGALPYHYHLILGPSFMLLVTTGDGSCATSRYEGIDSSR